jgi:hypothetical protein
MKKFAVASFNLFNLNEPDLPMYGKPGWTQAQYDKKIGYSAQTLQRLNADVIGFQELWHEDSLKKVLATPALKDQYRLLTPPQTQGTKIVCAAAVRQGLDIQDTRWIEDFPDDFVLQSTGGDPQTPDIKLEIKGFSRPVLHTRIRLHAKAPWVNVYVCHFKSKGPTEIYREGWYDKEKHSMHREGIGAALSTLRRTAEAAALRFILTLQTKGTDEPVIVMGDINDSHHSNTQNILTGQPQFLYGFSEGGGDTDLYSTQIMQELRDTRDVHYTYVHQSIKESLDHILVSQEFYTNSKKRIWSFDGMVVSNDHLNFEDHKESGANDHGIIRASFAYDPVKAP